MPPEEELQVSYTDHVTCTGTCTYITVHVYVNYMHIYSTCTGYLVNLNLILILFPL